MLTRNFRVGTALALFAAASLSGCGDDIRSSSDGGAVLGCGDNILEPDEVCEGFELRDATCDSEGFSGGRLTCSSSCELDTSGCFTCGNDTIEADEVCDGAELRSATCASVMGAEFTGTLSCLAECGAFDTSACFLVSQVLPESSACDPAGPPCDAGLSCETISGISLCLDTCTVGQVADGCAGDETCLQVDSVDICVKRPVTGERCDASLPCADALEECMRTGFFEGADVTTCRKPCTTLGADAACVAGDECIPVPSGALDLQTGDSSGCDAAPCDATFSCQDILENGIVSRGCAKSVLACAAPVEYFDFDSSAEPVSSICDLGLGDSQAGWCTAPAGTTPRCEALLGETDPIGLCVGHCSANTCGTGFVCGTPVTPLLYETSSGAQVACNSVQQCDDNSLDCVNVGAGAECLAPLSVCIPE